MASAGGTHASRGGAHSATHTHRGGGEARGGEDGDFDARWGATKKGEQIDVVEPDMKAVTRLTKEGQKRNPGHAPRPPPPAARSRAQLITRRYCPHSIGVRAQTAAPQRLCLSLLPA